MFGYLQHERGKEVRAAVNLFGDIFTKYKIMRTFEIPERRWGWSSLEFDFEIF